jgi:hypothetical protein
VCEDVTDRKSPDRNLLLRTAPTQRCAGEGELVFGLTRHAVTDTDRKSLFARLRVLRAAAGESGS